MHVGAKRKSEATDALMFLAAMEEGAEERAQRAEEKRAKREAEMEERRQERDRKHEERMQAQFFSIFQMMMGGGWGTGPHVQQHPIGANPPILDPTMMFPPYPPIPPSTPTEDEEAPDTPPPTSGV